MIQVVAVWLLGFDAVVFFYYVDRDDAAVQNLAFLRSLLICDAKIVRVDRAGRHYCSFAFPSVFLLLGLAFLEDMENHKQAECELCQVCGDHLIAADLERDVVHQLHGQAHHAIVEKAS